MLADLDDNRATRNVVEEAGDVGPSEPARTLLKAFLNLGESVRHAAIWNTADAGGNIEHLPHIAALFLETVEQRSLDNPVVHAGHYDAALAGATRLLFEHAGLWIEYELAAMQLRLKSTDVAIRVLLEVRDLSPRHIRWRGVPILTNAQPCSLQYALRCRLVEVLAHCARVGRCRLASPHPPH